MALVAGNSLSENIIHEIQTRGLAFRPNEGYKSLLTIAGADAALVSAVEVAKVGQSSPERQGETELLTHLSAAGS
jgi:hypothetical protein